ncbi:MAG TPA: leucyl aminopeptidase family protein [Allosphingosinicella sp.]|jgi:leucyl aminopeptidase
MTDLSALLQPDKGQPATALHLLDKKGFEAWLKAQPARTRSAAAAQGFRAEPNQVAILPGERDEWSAALGVAGMDELTPWCLAKAAEALPEGIYRVAGASPGAAALGWLLGQYRFTRYKAEKAPKGPRVLLTDAPAPIDETVALAEATALVRDLVNTPAQDMGPRDLAEAASVLVAEFGAELKMTEGAELQAGYPMVHAVGRAAVSERAPRLVELFWGDRRHPRIAIVGKGVVFDTGGLDIKPADGMRLMKKDMGGAAHALALARLVMALRLPVRLHMLVPAAENAIAGDAFRPGDVLKSRKGLTVEVGNTDAEGRLILGDALTRAGEENPELILDFATLTGAARVALGPELPALFCNDDALADALLAAGSATGDPLWRMPLWKNYSEMLSSDIADIGNVAEGGMAGAVTAALFLERFVPEATPWAHLDTFAWSAKPRPGRPKGGDALGLRAAWEMLKGRYAT